MTTRTVPDLKELFKQAAEIAQQVPPNMQEAAFNRAVDLLTGGGGSDGSSHGEAIGTGAGGRQSAGPRSKVPAGKGTAPPAPASNHVDTLLQGINSTQHPAVATAAKNLDRALMVLKIALDEHNIDGLTPTAIARVLREKFRVSVQDNGVVMALSRAAALVDRVKGPDGYVYRIMAPGNAYLAKGDGPPTTGQKPTGRKPKKKATVASKSETRKERAPKTTDARAVPVAKRKSGGGALAPKAAVLGLIGEGYFDSPKTGTAVRAHLQTKRGYTIGADQLRTAMLRLVRDQKLERETSADNEYEYKRK